MEESVPIYFRKCYVLMTISNKLILIPWTLLGLHIEVGVREYVSIPINKFKNKSEDLVSFRINSFLLLLQ